MTTDSGEGQEPVSDGTTPIPRPRAGSPWAWCFALILVLGLLVFQLFMDFRGLSTAEGVGYAQVGRELARGNGFTTQVIEPLAVMRADEAGGTPDFAAMPALRIGPLQPLLTAAALSVTHWDHPVEPRSRVWLADRVIAALSALCFLGAVALSFALVRRLFDLALATATALLLLLSDLLWKFSHSGLPHLLALLLTMLALCALVRAIERWQLGQLPVAALGLAGLACGLMVLALPLAIAPAIGLAGFAAVYFRRRPWLPLVFVVAILVVVAPWWLRNAGVPGAGLFGLAESSLLSEPGTLSEERYLAAFDARDDALVRVDVVRKLVRQIAVQVSLWWPATGFSIAAVLFFLSLLHPFRSPVVRALRWALLATWLMACLGMALAGVSAGDGMQPNALHVLFLPLFSAYGLALLALLWNRTELARNRFSLWRHAHFLVVIGLTALPLLVALPGRLVLAERLSGRLVHWPPFDPYSLSRIGEWTADDALLMSDLPEAVAWYADRTVLRLPATPDNAGVILDRAGAAGHRVAGIYLSPRLVDGRWLSDTLHGEWRPWASLVLRTPDGGAAEALLEAHGLQAWLNLSPSADQRAWLICDRDYWRQRE